MRSLIEYDSIAINGKHSTNGYRDVKKKCRRYQIDVYFTASKLADPLNTLRNFQLVIIFYGNGVTRIIT